MTSLGSEIKAVREAFAELGCPICGGAARSLSVRYLSTIEIESCGHTVSSEDARDMPAFYKEVWAPEYDKDYEEAYRNVVRPPHGRPLQP